MSAYRLFRAHYFVKCYKFQTRQRKLYYNEAVTPGYEANHSMRR